MLVLGLLLLILGLVFGIQILWVIGIILLVCGALLWVAPQSWQGGRRWY